MPPSNDDHDSDHEHNSNGNNNNSNGNNGNSDISFNITYNVTSNPTYVSNVVDISSNQVFSAVCDDLTDMPVPVPIISDLSSNVFHGPGYDITNQTGKSSDGSNIIREIFTSSTDPSNNDVNIN